MTENNNVPAPRNENNSPLKIFDEENEFSLINKVPECMVEKIKKVGNSHAKLRNNGGLVPWLSLTTVEARELVRPSAALNRARVAFWNEYEAACRTGQRMEYSRIYGGICSLEHFSHLMAHTKNVAWLMQPVASYKASLEEALMHSTAELRKILEADIYKKDGTLNTAVMNLKVKIHKMLEDRALGAVAQKLETKSVNVNATATVGSDGVAKIDVDEELQKIRKQVTNNEKVVRPEVIDVTEENVREVKSSFGASEE